MSLDFADTCFWIALANPKDELHIKAVELIEQKAHQTSNNPRNTWGIS